MDLSFSELYIEIEYKNKINKHVTQKFECNKDNISDSIRVFYTRDENKIKLSILPIEKLFINQVTLTFKVDYSKDIKCFVNGYQSWTFTGILSSHTKKRKPWPRFVIANQENAKHPPKGKKGIIQSDMLLVCGDSSSEQGILFGQLPFENNFHQFVSFEFNYRTQLLSIIWDIEKYCDSEDEYTLDPIYIIQGNAWKILQAYSNIIHQEVKPNFNTTLRKGWCSWYYYYNRITKDEIIANARFAQRHSIPFDFFQIDDGYQTTIGDWTFVKNSFIAAMRSIADTIRECGFVPGIWYSPFIVSKHSRIFKENSSWILKDANGKPVIAGYNPAWGGYYYAVDVTIPAVLQWIEDTIATLRYEWGYEYIKLDFMYAAALPGERHNTTISRYEALKNATARIRKASGNAFLLGCGMPLQSGIGYIDGMRIGPDVAPHWGRNLFDVLFNSDSGVSTLSALRSSLLRSFMHNRFWINDPDCLMIRQHKTKLNQYERVTLHNVITCLGGMLVISDKLTEYSNAEIDTLIKACDLFELAKDGNIYIYGLFNELPYALYNDKGLLVVLNLSNSDISVAIPNDILQKHSAIYFYETGSTLQEHTIQLSPHASKILLLK